MGSGSAPAAQANSDPASSGRWQIRYVDVCSSGLWSNLADSWKVVDRGKSGVEINSDDSFFTAFIRRLAPNFPVAALARVFWVCIPDLISRPTDVVVRICGYFNFCLIMSVIFFISRCILLFLLPPLFQWLPPPYSRCVSGYIGLKCEFWMLPPAPPLFQWLPPSFFGRVSGYIGFQRVYWAFFCVHDCEAVLWVLGLSSVLAAFRYMVVSYVLRSVNRLARTSVRDTGSQSDCPSWTIISDVIASN